jgi:GntR family transcriptional regulator, histidine utilization repressor
MKPVINRASDASAFLATDANPRIAPLHQRILADIEHKVISGEWPPGHRIPFEVELASQYSCSRMTVGRALSQLVRSGLIERRRKSGSFVAKPLAQSALLEIRDIRSEVETLGLAYGYGLLERSTRKASMADRRHLGIDTPAPVLHLACCHFAAGKPFCFEERLINLATVPSARGQAFDLRAPGPWLLERVPWSAAEHTIRSIPVDERIATALKAPLGTPCLSVERRTWSSDGAALTYVQLTYLGDTHALVARFEPSKAG